MDSQLERKILRIITRPEQFRRRAARMLAASDRGEPLPKDAEFHEDELNSLESNASDLAVELVGSVPEASDWTPPVRFAYRNYGSFIVRDPMAWLKQLQQGLRISQEFFESFLSSAPGEIYMGDKINVGNAEVVMSRSSAKDITMHGSVHQDINSTDSYSDCR